MAIKVLKVEGVNANALREFAHEVYIMRSAKIRDDIKVSPFLIGPWMFSVLTLCYYW